MNRKKLLLLILLALNSFDFFSQEEIKFTRQDTLRGSITPEREWWDLTYYHLDIKVEPDKKFISGKNTIQYKVLKTDSVMQIDLQTPMQIVKVLQDGEELKSQNMMETHILFILKKIK